MNIYTSTLYNTHALSSASSSTTSIPKLNHSSRFDALVQESSTALNQATTSQTQSETPYELKKLSLPPWFMELSSPYSNVLYSTGSGAELVQREQYFQENKAELKEYGRIYQKVDAELKEKYQIDSSNHYEKLVADQEFSEHYYQSLKAGILSNPKAAELMNKLEITPR